jgi:hypothetical protein
MANRKPAFSKMGILMTSLRPGITLELLLDVASVQKLLRHKKADEVSGPSVSIYLECFCSLD